MATLDILPATTYCPPSSSAQARRRCKELNTIIEHVEQSPLSTPVPALRVQCQESDSAWFSPADDRFPTPRGRHFMVAPHIPDSPSSANSSLPSSARWTRDSFVTQATDFDDLYDASDDESHLKNNVSPAVSAMARNSLPTLVIPDDVQRPPRKFASPIAPTPPPKIPMSPTLLEYLSVQDVPSTSATPSLDGSLSSEQLANMSAPATPATESVFGDHEVSWGGIQLQPEAVATLQALSSGESEETFEQQIEQVLEISAMSPAVEMQQSPPPLVTNIHRHNSVVVTPQQQCWLDSLSKLDIPSPGGFFSSLSANSRHTWDFSLLSPKSAPPSSAAAEMFYKTPWAIDSASDSVEQTIETSADMSDDCPTARPTLASRTTVSPEPYGEEEIVATEILDDYNEDYIRKLKDASSANMDRTNLWLNSQVSYLSTLINPPEDRDDETALLRREANAVQPVKSAEKATAASPSPTQKTVRFSEVVMTKTLQEDITPLPKPKSKPQESAYFRSFNQFVNRSRYRDTYVHRTPRFEALQAQRVNFPEAYRNQLLGKYQLSVPESPTKRASSNVVRGDETTPVDAERLKTDKEYEAMDQMKVAAWGVMASRTLNGGRLIAAPVAKKLARLSKMGPTEDGRPRERARILDLGGQAACDWAWHCAAEYPNAKVYTLTTQAERQLSNSNIRGPKNHRQIAVEKLTKLPFADNQFDVISARNLYALLKASSENGEDEYDVCLKECMRCLKPGGYLEFSLLDSDIVNAGPLGLARSVEFGFNLKTRGYDPTPTKSWIRRLKKAGFVGTKRAWLFLPMGATIPSTPTTRDSLGVEVPLELEAMVSGSTNAAANIAGLVGGCAWEKWMLKLQVESGKSDDSLLENVYNIIEEGRKCGAGWRTLRGWARKPLAK